MITEVDGDEIAATASVAVWRFRAGESSPYVGRYDVRLRRTDGQLKLCFKRATLDQEALSDHGALSIIF
jgi:3-phenylpropionate/cinnamic acid dioxygenase small subunit